MNLLLDTHTLLWALGDPGMLDERARVTVADAANEVFVSAATAWEIGIKSAIGKLRAPGDLERQMQLQRFRALPVTVTHGLAVRELPMHHRDPFDRMLVAQARTERLVVVTRDEHIPKYDVATLVA